MKHLTTEQFQQGQHLSVELLQVLLIIEISMQTSSNTQFEMLIAINKGE